MPYIASLSIVGGTGGNPFGFDGAQSGAVLKKLDVWIGPTQVRCIKFLMSDNAERTYGKCGDDRFSFTFDEGEYFSSLNLWPNNAENRLGGIQFTTSLNRKFEVFGSNGKPSRTPTAVDVGSGICFGVKGRSGTEIDAFGLMFIKVSK